ncbi:hypothetical protein [Xylanimonas protaetiae]|uniref:PKD domain-containing protein n=1 Tax=Xylanimonas protaetiae TaxID=2509457 RepID=A0A4P6F505_9MICO|nr:hypothetical protein [Xylanimonas protaetiae]QAY70684.1 hypothetical protein ET471_12200 [Xylanimonas protaetiae]
MDANGGAWESTPDDPKAKTSILPPTKYLRADAATCSLYDLDAYVDTIIQMGGCTDGRVQAVADAPCPSGTYELAPLWVQRLQPDSTYGPAEQVTAAQCITPADVATQAQQAFATMHVPAPTATLQTGNPNVLLVNAWYPVYTSDEPVTQQATLLDVPVEIRAVPERFTWDFDDPFSGTGPTLTTTDPGRAWHDGEDVPDERWVAHAWTRLGNPDSAADRAQGTGWDADAGAKYRTDVTITLATTWHGQFRIAGTLAWADIPGQLTTTSAAGTYTVAESPARLYCDDLVGGSTC